MPCTRGFRLRPLSCLAGLVGVLAGLAPSLPAHAVPLWFLLQPAGNMRDVQWRRLESKRFSIYHDARAEPVGRTALTALESAYQDMSLLLGVTLDTPDGKPPGPFRKEYLTSKFARIPVVISTRTTVGGFAEFVTQNLELQVSTGSQAALYQHELAHRLMYEHMDIHLGAGGRAATIAMIPTWWTEGLPEYLTESMGRLETAGVARSLALEGGYVTWDRLHSLYNATGDAMVRGYVTSGRFFRYLVENSTISDLHDLHRDFFKRIITPPFVNGVDRLLQKHWGKDGRSLYADFQADERARWQTALAGLPPLAPRPPAANGYISGSGTFDVSVSGDHAFLSNLSAQPQEGAIVHTNLTSGETRRLPLDVEGSTIFHVHPSETRDGTFVTARFERFPNGAGGFQLRFVRFEGALASLTQERVKEVVDLPVATPDDPVRITQVKSLGKGKGFALGNVRGQTVLMSWDLDKRSTTIVARWDSPVTVRFLARAPNANDSCMHLLIDADAEKTSVERICGEGARSIVVPPEKVYVRDGTVRADGSLLLLVGWHSALGLVEWKEGAARAVASFPDWGEGLTPTTNLDEVLFWKYRQGQYRLVRVSLAEIESRYRTWALTKEPDSPWRQPPRYQPYLPPFAKQAALLRESLVARERLESGDPRHASVPGKSDVATAVAEEGTPLAQSLPATKPAASPTASPTASPREAPRAEDADFRNRHLFTYPNIIPPPFGGWSLGLVSVPLIDEMSRHRLQLFATYDFSTRSLSGTAQYVNNRIFDAFSTSVYSRERFNGLYFLAPCTVGGTNTYCGQPRQTPNAVRRSYYSYLRETGVDMTASLRFRPTSLVLDGRISVDGVKPLYGSRNPSLGVQRATLVSAGATLSATPFEKEFYLGDPHSLGGDVLSWVTGTSLSADKTVSVGKTYAGNGQREMPLSYQRLGASLSSSLIYDGHKLTYRGNIAGTLGPRALNYREIYAPYRTYLAGSGGSLNNLSYYLAGGSELFAYSAGAWSYRNGIDYSFPIWRSLDRAFYIAYLDTIRGEVVLARGGVARNRNFTDLTAVTSVSFATKMTIDFKGVEVFPSLAFGRLLGRPGWSLFTELAFSQFF